MPRSSRKVPAATQAKSKSKPNKIRSAAVSLTPYPKLTSETGASLTGESSEDAARQLPPAWEIARTSALLLWQYRKPLLGIIGIYALLNLVLVQGLANGLNINSLKSQVAQSSSGQFGQLASGLTVFAYMVGSAGGSLKSAGGAYELFLLIVASLAVIWALKQIHSGVTFQIREAFYRGMYPLVPVILVLAVVGLQSLPLLLGATLYNLLVNNGIVIGAFEIGLVALLFAAAACVTLYMLSASLFALYTATTPDITPRTALRLSRELVRGRRWSVLRKILFLPLALLLAGAIVMVPAIVVVTPLAPWVFFVLTVFAVVAVHGYMYTLYRELAYEEAQ